MALLFFSFQLQPPAIAVAQVESSFYCPLSLFSRWSGRHFRVVAFSPHHSHFYFHCGSNLIHLFSCILCSSLLIPTVKYRPPESRDLAASCSLVSSWEDIVTWWVAIRCALSERMPLVTVSPSTSAASAVRSTRDQSGELSFLFSSISMAQVFLFSNICLGNKLSELAEGFLNFRMNATSFITADSVY